MLRVYSCFGYIFCALYAALSHSCADAMYMKRENSFLTLLPLGTQEAACACWQMPEFRQRVDVLRRLGYVAADNTVQLKVCCLSTDCKHVGTSCSRMLHITAPLWA